MRNVLITSTAILAAVCAFCGSTSAADGPSAHDPRFENRELWPAESEKSAYVKETWPEARLLVWALPGSTDRRLDGSDPANWLENGRPATEPIDENTDLYVPDAEEPYRVNLFTKSSTTLRARHITVGRNASVRMPWAGTTGNVWVREGGDIVISNSVGSKHTFFRSDNPEPEDLGGDFAISKNKDASTEFVGQFKIGDRLFLKAGRMVLSPGSVFMPGSRDHRTPIYPGATLVLLSGSRLSRWTNQSLNLDIALGGTLLAGLPERPLTEDCRLGLSYKLRDLGVGNTASHSTKDHADDRGLVVLEGGKIQVHSADPQTARLVIYWQGLVNEEHDKQLIAANRTPHRVAIVFLEDVQLDGVLFDHFLPGGIELANPEMRSAWKNIFFGQHNECGPEDLFSKHKGGVPYRL